MGIAWGLPAGGILGAVTGAAVAGRMGYALGKNALGPGCGCCS